MFFVPNSTLSDITTASPASFGPVLAWPKANLPPHFCVEHIHVLIFKVCFLKTTNKMKRHPMAWEEIFASTYLIRG